MKPLALLTISLLPFLTLSQPALAQPLSTTTTPKASVNLNPKLRAIHIPPIPLPQAIQQLFTAAGLVGPYHEIRGRSEIRDRVSGDYTDMTLEEILWEILNQAKHPLTYNRLQGKYLIEPGPLPSRPTPGVKRLGVREGIEEDVPEGKRPDLVVMSGHGEEVDGLAISPNEEYIVSSSSDNVTNLWLRRTRSVIRGFQGQASGTAFSSDGKHLITALGSTVFIWDVETGSLVKSTKPYHEAGVVNQVIPSPNLRQPGAFATSGFDNTSNSNTISFWPNESARATITIKTDRDRFALAFSTDGEMVLGWSGKEVQYWRFPSGELLGRVAIADTSIAAISPDHHWLAIATRRGQIHFLPMQPDSQTLQPERSHFSTLGRNPELLSTPAPPPKDPLDAPFVPLYCAFQPGSPATLAMSAPGGKIYLADLNQQRLLPLVLAGHQFAYQYSNLGVRAFSFSPKGELLLSSGHHARSPERQLRLWDTHTGALGLPLNYESHAIRFLALGGREDRFALVGGEHGVWHWDLGMQHPPRRLPTSLPLAVSTDRQWFLTATEEFYANAPVCEPDAYKNAPVTAPKEHQTLEQIKQSTARQRKIEETPVRGVALWDMQTGERKSVFLPFAGTVGRCQALTFSHDGRFLFAGGWEDAAIHLWTVSGESRLPFAGQHAVPVNRLQLSGNDFLLLSEDVKGDVVLWNTATGKVHARPRQGQLFRNGDLLHDDDKKMPFANFPTVTPETPNAVVVLLSEKGNSFLQVPLATVQGNRVRLYNAINGERFLFQVRENSEETSETAFGTSVQFSDDGWEIYISDERETRRYSLWSGALLEHFPLSGHLLTRSLADGGSLLLGRRGKDAKTPAWYNNGRVVPFFNGHVSPIVSLDATRQGNLMATGSQDGTVRLWDVKQRREIAAYIGTDAPPAPIVGPVAPVVGPVPPSLPAEYIVAQASPNLYMASKGALNKVSFRIGDETFPFAQFDLRLNRPDLLLTTLNAWFHAVPDAVIQQKALAHRARLRKFKLEPALLKADDLRVPHIAFVGGSPKSPVTGRNLTVTVEAHDERFPIVRFQVYINDSYIDLPDLEVSDNKPGTPVRRQFLLPLTLDENRIEITAVNSQQLESLKLISHVTCTLSGPAPRLCVFTVGVSKYANISELTWCDADAIGIAETLRKMGPRVGNKAGASLYPELVIAPPLVNGAATRAAILQQLAEFVAKTRPEDQLIVFLAGHGMVDEETEAYYFGCHDVSLTKLAQTGVSFDEIDDILKKAPARLKLLMMDTCHSGDYIRMEEPAGTVLPEETKVPLGSVVARGIGITKGSGTQKFAPPKRDWAQQVQDLFADLRRGSGAEVLAASIGIDKAQEKDQLRHGVFTYAFLEALTHFPLNSTRPHAWADSNKDGWVSSMELLNFITDATRRRTGDAQRPTARRTNPDSPFRLRTGAGLAIEFQAQPRPKGK